MSTDHGEPKCSLCGETVVHFWSMNCSKCCIKSLGIEMGEKYSDENREKYRKLRDPNGEYDKVCRCLCQNVLSDLKLLTDSRVPYRDWENEWRTMERFVWGRLTGSTRNDHF